MPARSARAPSSLDPTPQTQPNGRRQPGSRHAPTARPACDTVTAEPGQSPLARPTAETAAPRPPFLAAVGAPRSPQLGGQGETTTVSPPA